MTRLKEHVMRVARDGFVTALIMGESGTGKERVAGAIHRLSPRATHPFVVVNCAGLSPTLAEDELFGHVRGAYTGASTDRSGPFERANGGTVFLDEVGELAPDLQMKLLRALQQRTVQRLGSACETPFEVRVVAATNRDLRLAVERGRFRQDLYYRLKVCELSVPPLRDRTAADLRRLVDRLTTDLCTRRNRLPVALAPDVWSAFVRYRWPGNVRELENTLERMIVAAGGGGLLTSAHLPCDLARSPAGMVALVAGSTSDAQQPPRELPSPAEALAALQRNKFKCGDTASQLGLSRHQLYRLLRRQAASSPPGSRTLAWREPALGESRPVASRA